MIVEFVHENVPTTPLPDIAINLFRVLQEVLSNAAKHSGASRCYVALCGRGDERSDTVLTQNRASLLQRAVPMCIDSARCSFSFRQQSQPLRSEAAAVPQDRDQAGATTGRFHALVATLPVEIAAYSSGSNGMRTRLALPVRVPTTNTLQIWVVQHNVNFVYGKFRFEPAAAEVLMTTDEVLESSLERQAPLRSPRAIFHPQIPAAIVV